MTTRSVENYSIKSLRGKNKQENAQRPTKHGQRRQEIQAVDEKRERNGWSSFPSALHPIPPVLHLYSVFLLGDLKLGAPGGFLKYFLTHKLESVLGIGSMSGRPRTTSFAESCKPVAQPSAFGSMKVSSEYLSSFRFPQRERER